MLRLAGTKLLRCAAGQRAACVAAAGRQMAAAASSEAEAQERQRLVNKLLYRSKQRGFLELDLLVGLWAEQQVPRMDADMLRQFTAVLDQENPDLFKWLTGQQAAPPAMQHNRAYQALSRHVAQQLSENAPQATLAAAGKEWVRGWDDSWRSAASAGVQQQQQQQQQSG